MKHTLCVKCGWLLSDLDKTIWELAKHWKVKPSELMNKIDKKKKVRRKTND